MKKSMKVPEIISIIRDNKEVASVDTSGLHALGSSRYITLKNGQKIRVSNHPPSPYDCHNRPCDLYIETRQYDEDCYPTGNTTPSDVVRLITLI